MLFKKPYGDVELYHGPFGYLTGRGGWGTVFYGTKGIVAVNRGKIAVWEGVGIKPTLEIRKQLEDVSFSGMKLVAASIGKDYGDDAEAKKDNKLDVTLKKLAAVYKLDQAPVQLYKTTSKSQVENFVQCVESRAETVSTAETGARGAVLCQLCNMSYVYDTGFDWDPVNLDFAGESRKLGIPLKRDYCRNGWEVKV
jgi:hypothetical protein